MDFQTYSKIRRQVDKYLKLYLFLLVAKRECPENFDRVGDECFYIEETAANFTDATTACRGMGANLASITNVNAQTYIDNYLEFNIVTRLFIGGEIVTDGTPPFDGMDNTGLWIDGTYWSPFMYFDAEIGKDVLSADAEGCIISRNSNLGWAQEDCYDEMSYICKTSLGRMVCQCSILLDKNFAPNCNIPQEKEYFSRLCRRISGTI